MVEEGSRGGLGDVGDVCGTMEIQSKAQTEFILICVSEGRNKIRGLMNFSLYV